MQQADKEAAPARRQAVTLVEGRTVVAPFTLASFRERLLQYLLTLSVQAEHSQSLGRECAERPAPRKACGGAGETAKA